MSDTSLRDRLAQTARDLAEYRQTHVVWRDWLQKDSANAAVNPHAGSAEFHAGVILDYDRHLANISEAIAALSPPALEGMDGWITWANYADRMVTVVLDEWPKAGVQVNTRIRLASPAPAQQAVTDEMVRRASLAYEVEMEGCVYGPEAPESAMRSALKAALAPNAAGDTPPATQEVL